MASKRKNNTAHARTRRAPKKEFKFSDLTQKQKLLVKIGAIAVALLLILIVVLYRTDRLPHLDGSLHFRKGQLVGVAENDLIINRESGKYGENGNYFLVGSIDTPEGYVEYRDIVSTNDGYKQAFGFKPANPEESFVSSIAIQGCLKGHEDLIHNVLGESDETMLYSGRIDGVSPEKQNVYHASVRTSLTRDEGTGYYYKFATAYIETDVKDSCIMIQLTYKNAYKKEIPSDDYAMAELIELVDIVNVIK